MKKKQLNYSALTDTVFWVDGKGEQTDVTQNFIQMILCWTNKGSLPEVGKENTKCLRVDGKVHWEITCKRIAE